MGIFAGHYSAAPEENNTPRAGTLLEARESMDCSTSSLC